ncbi:Ethanolamine utilization protein EutN/carboxysome [Polystyrenella longa]|uniref:Ethanolamine utilization protein EutN/carboxysome n=1 Tax=Polystyrenella longa TaxID=2528007 RepID=A0A518CI19_9PLAN|nr:EutN/CcmL family microcompartment protein [Polystyrenella longa]QDU78878.1 Ethanolamine utilization protein EutN/carboxysome [Polystyrenella longa]
MRIAEVIGKVTLSQPHSSLRGGRWVLAVPLTKEGLQGKKTGRGEPFVVYDDIGCNAGCRIAVSEGGEAAAPFHPDKKPIDAYAAAILDHIEVESK